MNEALGLIVASQLRDTEWVLITIRVAMVTNMVGDVWIFTLPISS